MSLLPLSSRTLLCLTGLVFLAACDVGTESGSGNSGCILGSCGGGSGPGGDLPNPPTANPHPVPVAGTMKFQMVSAGRDHVCGLTLESIPVCWGKGSEGQLGDGTTLTRSTPAPIANPEPFAEIDAGSGHTCGFTARNGRVYCWGGGGAHPFDNSSNVTIPLFLGRDLKFVSIGTGKHHSCGIAADGLAWCWGSGPEGQLGAGSSTSRIGPVSGTNRYSSIDAGERHTCALTSSGEAYCWGDNSSGQLGTTEGKPCGITQVRLCSDVPVPVQGGLRFKAVSVGSLHTCGVTLQGKAYCWGLNSYENLLGSTAVPDTGNSYSHIPVPVEGGLTFARISAGGGHTCGVTVDGVGYCWGNNSFGALGDGTQARGSRPVRVMGGLRFAQISAGHGFTCAVTTEHNAYCWGARGRDFGPVW